MSFLSKLRLKKKKKSKDVWAKLSNDTKKMYFTEEFQCFGDITRDGSMNLEEFYRLMMLLQFQEGREGAKAIWKSRGKSDGARLTLDEYVSMMLDKKVDAKTNMWRKLFAEIDTDGSCTATKGEVLRGLEKMGIEVNADMRKKICGMDDDRDGSIGYADFLRVQLKQ